jgi:DNA (cytosine-5)-methyltransferase 1
MKSVLPVPEGTANHRPSVLKAESRAGKIAARIGPGQKLCNVRAGTSAVHTWNIPEVFGETSAAEKELLEAILRLRRRKRQRSWGDADPVKHAEVKRLFGRGAGSLIKSLVAKSYLRYVGEEALDLTQTFNGKFRRLTMDGPTNCVLTKFCEAPYFLHPLEQRAFTVREAARLQGFADTFVFLGSERSQAAQVGNAVPPPLARHIAEWLLEVL